jgi:hypothetical protein
LEGWRANVRSDLTTAELLAHHQKLLTLGANVRALIHRPSPTAGELVAGGGALARGFETYENPLDWWRVGRGFIDAILEDTLTPSSLTEWGTLPTIVDGLRQTHIVCAIVESAETGRVIDCAP